jgi:hypothetical protein
MLQTRYLAQKNSYHLHYKKNSAVILMFLKLSVIFLKFTLITLKYKHKKALFFKLTSALTLRNASFNHLMVFGVLTCKTTDKICEISSSHGVEYEVQNCLLGCTAV